MRGAADVDPGGERGALQAWVDAEEGAGGAGAGAAFGTQLHRLRQAAGLTQEALAERAAVGVRTLQSLEGGRQRPLRATAARLAPALGLSGDARARFLDAAQPAPRARGTAQRGGPVGVLRLVPASHQEATGAPPPSGSRRRGAAVGNLPVPLTSFVGREQDLAHLRALLDAGGAGQTPHRPVPAPPARLVTITGTGGVGKTRLALEGAAAAGPAYPAGVWLADLAPLADPELVPATVAAALGVREAPGRPLVATLIGALHSRRLLLVLDNCDHLLDACARLAEALLRACPRVTILATSREPLGILGETAWRLPSLALPLAPSASVAAGPADIATLAEAEAVRLFVDRARAVRPGFALTALNAPAVAGLCLRLDGIPLALELAAAHVRVLPPGQLLSRLDDRFRLLEGGSRTALPRQRTLRAAVDWSHDLLTEPERALFARLSVFAGGWTLEAAEEVGGIAPGEVLGLLTRLVDKSLVLVDEQPDGTARYRLLETLRQYAAERLAASGEVGAVSRDHAAHYLALAEVPDPEWRGPPQEAWLGRLEREHANLRAALRWALERGPGVQALRLGAPLGVLWRTRSHVTEGRARLAALLALPDPGPQEPRGRSARSSALISAARLARTRGDYAEARTHLQQSLALALGLGDRQRAGVARYHLGMVLRDAGEADAAGPMFEASLAAGRALGDERLVCGALFGLGFVALHAGDGATARRLAQESLALARPASRDVEISALVVLGAEATDRGDFGQARAHFREALAANEALGNQDYLATVLDYLAGLLAAAGQPARALRLYGAADALNVRLGARLDATRLARRARWLPAAEQALPAAAREVARASGRALTTEEAVADALEYLSHPPAAAGPARSSAQGALRQ